ncbi:MAG: hypothetical protein EOP33_02180 [Rickettsiaceae bacterium]|nr:MAG: hypothetical protein EOP33_02180 [Rickettsiaceae bacterium]
MYITCHQCKTSFVVSIEQIGTNGRKVKCSKCDYIWYQEPPALSTSSSETSNHNHDIVNSLYAHKEFYDHEYNLPALLPTKSSAKRNIMSIVLVFLVIILVTLLYQNNWQSNYVITTTGLNVNNVQVKKQEEVGKITISYCIINNSNKELEIPLVKIRLLDKNNHVVKTYINDKKLGIIKSGQSIGFEQEFTISIDIIKNVSITLGNKLDLILK